MSRPLTTQQRIVYDYIRDLIVSRGYGPTVREIGEHMEIKSPNGVMCHLRALERKGMITRAANKSRAIELTEPISRSGAELPIAGQVDQRGCILESDPSEKMDLSQLTGEGRIALRVRDHALQEISVRPGDLLIIHRQRAAEDGQLALIRRGETDLCLRYWLIDGPRIRLQPVNRSLPPTIVEHAEVLGVAVGLVREFALPWSAPTATLP